MVLGSVWIPLEIQPPSRRNSSPAQVGWWRSIASAFGLGCRIVAWWWVLIKEAARPEFKSQLFHFPTLRPWVTFFFFFLVFFVLLRPHPLHMETPRLGLESELYLPAKATATRNLSHVCNPHQSSWQCQILNLLSKARHQTRILMDTSQGHEPLSHNRNSLFFFFFLSEPSFRLYICNVSGDDDSTKLKEQLQLRFKP